MRIPAARSGVVQFDPSHFRSVGVMRGDFFLVWHMGNVRCATPVVRLMLPIPTAGIARRNFEDASAANPSASSDAARRGGVQGWPVSVRETSCAWPSVS